MPDPENAAGAAMTVGAAKMPAIGCGTWELRGETCARIVQAALETGYRSIDTAQGYSNEREVGEGIRASGMARERIFVTTKVRPQLVADGDLQRSAEESLARLGLDYIDLLLIHWPNPAVSTREMMVALSDAKCRGYTRHVGVSNFTTSRLREAVAVSPEPIVTNQIEYHPYLQQTRLIETMRELGIAVTAYCPIALGKVANDPALKEIAARHRRTPVQVALRWLIQHPDVAAIPRTSRVERLSENLAVIDFELSAAEVATVDRLRRAGLRLVNEPDWVPLWD